MKRNVHKIDDYLVRLGWPILVLVLIFGPHQSQWLFWAWAGGAVLMLAAGYFIRGREKKVHAVWEILDQVTEISMTDLCRSTGFERPFVRGSLELINAQPGAFYVWDPDTDRICDGRLRAQFVSPERCSSCGAAINEQVSLDLSKPPACRYCGGPVIDADMNQLKNDSLRRLREDARARQPGFSVVLFVVLLVIFWPAAIGYAVWRSGIIQGMQASRRLDA